MGNALQPSAFRPRHASRNPCRSCTLAVDCLIAKRPERPASQRSQGDLGLGKGDCSIAWVQRIDFGLGEADALDIADQA